MIKDAILCLMLINALIGQLKQIDLATLMASKTIVISNQTMIQPVEASTDIPEPKAQQDAILGEFTAYNSEVGQTDADPEIMASNKKVYAGAIACPTKYAFGTKIKVAGKTYTCEDRMAERYRDGEYFDIWMESGIAADNWGRQTLEYEIIK
jgi:3D (Asp-Asp-Asp) domain-containing protein